MHVSVWPRAERFSSRLSCLKGKSKVAAGNATSEFRPRLLLSSDGISWASASSPGDWDRNSYVTLWCQDKTRPLCTVHGTEPAPRHMHPVLHSPQGSGKNEHAPGSKIVFPLPVPGFHVLNDFFFMPNTRHSLNTNEFNLVLAPSDSRTCL